MSVAMGLCGYVAAWSLGLLAVAVAQPGWLRRAGFTAWVFAATAGVALASGLYWVWIALLRSTGVPYLWVEGGVLIALAVAAWKRRPIEPTAPRVVLATPGAIAGRVMLAMMLVGLLVSISLEAANNPYGSWDAWAMWNLKAKFLYHAQDNWTLTFTDMCGHGDYPLLLPLTIARTWCYIGRDTQIGPQLTAVVLSFQMAMVIAAGMMRLRGPVAAAASLAIFLSMPLVRLNLVNQYADTPLAGWMIGACLCAAIAWEREEPQQHLWLAATGLMAAAAAWTKNEGAVFAILLLVVLSMMLLPRQGKRAKHNLGALWGAALVLLACVVWMKLAYGGASDLAQPRNHEQLMALIRDPDRHARIIRLWRHVAVYQTGERWLWLCVILWVMLRGVQPRMTWVLWCVVPALQLAVYYSVYLLTPRDIGWHLATSADRVFMHLMPIAALLPAMLARPDQSALPEPTL